MLTIIATSRRAPNLGFLLHKHPERLHTVELAFGNARVFYPGVVFEFAKPVAVVVTTPAVEYKVRFETLPAGSFEPIGEVDPEVGAPTQMAVFQR